MITKKAQTASGLVRITFSLPNDDPAEPVSVVGDFNDWTESAHRLQLRSNGRRSVAVTVESGRRLRFRYRTASGQWFDEEAADGYEANSHGGHDGVVLT